MSRITRYNYKKNYVQTHECECPECNVRCDVKFERIEGFYISRVECPNCKKIHSEFKTIDMMNSLYGAVKRFEEIGLYLVKVNPVMSGNMFKRIACYLRKEWL